MNRNKIRVGLLLDSKWIKNWQNKVLQEVKCSDYAEVVLILFSKANDGFKTKSELLGRNKRNSFLIKAHMQIDRFLFGRNTVAEHLVYLDDFMQANNSIVTYDLSNSEAMNKAKAFILDVILDFSEKAMEEELLSMSRFGLWTCRYKGNLIDETGLGGYYEVVNHKEKIDILITQLKESHSAQTLFHSSMLPDYLSITKSRNAYFWRISQAILRMIEGLHIYGASYLQKLINRYASIELVDYQINPNELPGTLQLSKNAIVHFAYLLSRVRRKALYVDNWSLLYTTEVDRAFSPSLKGYKYLPQPKDRFWADPFVVSHNERNFIFVEELNYDSNKGHIAVVETNLKGDVLHYEKVLEKDFHLSYPMLLTYNDCYFMVPETGGNRTVEIYKCIEFPYKWEFVMNLMENVVAADATLFFYNNKWWLFCCIDGSGQGIGMLDELYLYYADNLFTQEWHSHPCNPVVADVSKARPAGSIFTKGNKIYRPSQDCSGMYGKAININEIKVLTETDYEETLVSRILPDGEKGIIGTHTFNFSESMAVVDGFKYKRR